MRKSMLFKLLAMFTAVILLCVLLMLSVFAIASREAQTQGRMQALKSQAYDIAYLAGAPSAQGLDYLFDTGLAAMRRLMERKLRAVYEEYGAYCLVVGRNGQVTSYFSSVLSEHRELARQFDPADIVSTLSRVLGGEEVVTQSRGEAGPMFTVAVPWVQDGAVRGAVYIQTAAQNVQAAYEGIWKQAALAALAAFLAAAAIAFVYTRRLMRPLEHIASSAGLMARGLPAPPAPEGGAAELNELSAAFNRMARKIQDTEQSRRDFIANLSHELRSPMTSIQGFLTGILDGTVRPEDTRQTLTVVVDETRRLGSLVNGLLSLSRAEAPESKPRMAPFNLSELTRRAAITRLKAMEDKGIRLQTDFPEEDPFAMAEQDQIEQVLINLMDNAIRFTPPGGEITLRIREKDRNTLAVTVRDNGAGVLPQDADRIFERFYTGDAAHTPGGGVGLGLAICRTILEKHGQVIRLLPGGPGAAFEFTLARADRAPGKPHAD